MLAELIVAAFFGKPPPPAALRIGLALHGTEVVDDGYRRATVLKGDWQVIGRTAAAEVDFGPFVGAVRFDQVLVLAGDDVLERVQLAGEVSLLADMAYSHRVSVRVGTDG